MRAQATAKRQRPTVTTASPTIGGVRACERCHVELAHLQREVYQWWGVKIDVEGRENEPLGLYDELDHEVPLALTEQRERCSICVDSHHRRDGRGTCPANKHAGRLGHGAAFARASTSTSASRPRRLDG